MSTLISHLIGKTVQLYPGDTKEKFAIVEDLCSQGFLFRITKSDDSKSFPVNSLMFVGGGSNIKFIVQENQPKGVK